ncbi:MAG: hypothetical protein H9535_06080 [Ignavibacteria bacterium]|nr:hypothetical protein [Ignavibacteria bacterium]
MKSTFFSVFIALLTMPLAALAQKAPAASTEKPLARVLQQPIVASQLEPDDKTKQQAKQALKGKYNEWLTQIRYVKMAALIWEPLQQQFLKEKNITVAPNEVTTFFDYAKKAREMQKTQFQQNLQQLNAQMQSGQLTAQQKQQGEALKKQFQDALTQLSKPLPDPSQQEKDFAQRTVQVWKFDQSLYKQFGGTVVMKQANPFEPIGAYKKFLEDKEKGKSFEILDATYKKNFWKMFDVPKEAVVVPANKVDYSKPWWILMVEQAQQMKK